MSRNMRALVLAMTALIAASLSAQGAPIELDIHVDQPLHTVSPMLYGLMTEEINYSYDGGLYAEMVRNRTMRDLKEWFLVTNGNSAGEIRIDRSTGPSAALPGSLLLEVSAADAADQAGVCNDGWWGMAVKPNTSYHGAFYAKAAGQGVGPVHVQLINDSSGAVLASATVPEPASSWMRYEFELNTGKMMSSANNHLAITIEHPGKLWLTLVSLFPPTYNDRANGNRPDLMEMMAAMHPAFLRLPGGNYLEGDEIQDRYDWKNTVGPLVDRATHPSPWRYQSSDGMGLLEFLEWTEDLNMEPVLAVYAGYSLKGAHVNPGPYLQPFVDDALDEIEFVSGDVGTKWGAVRARLGHPKPFPLHYVEIGNEDWFDRSGSYEGRFAQFDKAIKAKFPALQTIATAPLKEMRPDVQDDHYYLRASESYQHATLYDKTDRKGPKIFVGEWATREGSPTPNMDSALGDAALMTGFERNSDLIVMASYAPLFVNVNPGGMQWESDLIGYDASSSYGSPSYYAQVLFASYLGDNVPASSISNAPERFFYSVTTSASKGRLYLKLVNGASLPRTVTLHLEGAAALGHEGVVETLGSVSSTATNTILDPRHIVPVKTILRGVAPRFEHVVLPFSIQVIELRTR